MRSPAKVRAAGFTLLEILVALVVLGLLMAGLSQGMHFGLEAWDRQSETIDRQAEQDTIDRLMRRLVEQADPGSANVPAEIAGTSRTLRFVTDLRGEAGPAVAGLAEVAVGVDAGHKLVLRWTPFLHAQRLSGAPAPSDHALLDGVDHVEFAYWGHRGSEPDKWSDTWSGPALPALVRIRVAFLPGDSRRWPPLVIAPMRHKAI